MVFGLFNRKSDEGSKPNDHDARLPTPTPSIASVTHPSPLRFSTILRGAFNGSSSSLPPDGLGLAEGVPLPPSSSSTSPPPAVTPSPHSSVGPNDTKALYDLMVKIPPKTLHAYTLSHLCPGPPPLLSSTSTSMALPAPTPELLPETELRPPSPNTINKLLTFFSTLAPPPLLHCVRCHKDFYQVENEEKDKACRVAHDDESALVSRVSGGGGYETLWGCCGRTASGDGSEGPPDGWCYEGRHTTDIKRARFRADSTIHDDKLTSCLKLNCRGIRDRLGQRDGLGDAGPSRKSHPSPTRSQASVARSTRKRPRKSLKEASSSENEASIPAEESDKPTNNPAQPKPISKRSVARVRPPTSTSTTASNSVPVVPKPKRTGAKVGKSTSTTLISQSQAHAPIVSDSEASETAQARPRTRSRVREESRTRAVSSKLTKASGERITRARLSEKDSSRSMVLEERQTDTGDDRESEQEEERGRQRKKRRMKRD